MEQSDTERGQWIAIVGMSGRFPGARNLDEFWDNLVRGRDCIARFDVEELLRAGIDPQIARSANYVPAAPMLADVDRFDAGFFGISAREAKTLAPAMRLFLECAWETFENAGCVPGEVGDNVGVYAGVNLSRYAHFNAAAPDLEHILGNDKDYLATHVSYKLNLKGPSLSVQTACSTSLVAVHMASQALLSHQCDLALAGGSAVRIPQAAGYLREEDSILSPDGHCRPFDAADSGPVFGSGVGVVLLKRLDDALADGDCIRAVIRGSAVNNDGARKAGFAAPSADGQAAVIALAQALADAPARAISYIEAHGTGTNLGDPIEVAALTRAFRLDTRDRGFCALGSVKGNVGHLETAAGIAGLIKTVLALEHRQIPASLHFETPNPEIDFASSPFFVNTALRPWAADGVRLAGVSSFGMGGTNAHVVLAEAPQRASRPAGDAPQLLVFSARSAGALEQTRRNVGEYLARHPALPLADAAFTLGAGRTAFEHRCAVVRAKDGEAIVATKPAAHDPRPAPRLGFSFGDCRTASALAHRLYREESEFRGSVEACVAAGAGPDVQSWFAADGIAPMIGPALSFTVQYALAGLLQHWGLKPVAWRARGVGQAVAACVRGELALEAALSRIHRAVPAPQSHTRDGADLWIEFDSQSPRSADSFAIEGAPATDAPHAGRSTMLALLGELWAAGVSPDWHALSGGGRRVMLPTYPFERQRYWIEEPASAPAAADRNPVSEADIMPAPLPAADAPPDKDQITRLLRAIVGKAIHVAPEDVDPQREFIEMGADSLVLIESIQAIRKTYGVRLAVREIFEKLTNIDALAAHLAGTLRAGAASPVAVARPVRIAEAAPRNTVAAPRWGVASTEAEQLDARQRRHLDGLIARYGRKTARSRQVAAENRARLADVRMAAGFKLLIKEMLYPIVVERSEGAHVTDVDGNDYIDVTMGFGVHLFGHKPPFLTEALRDQLERDAPLGPENRDSGPVARLLCEMTGTERAAFFNTGTEAVMTALRLVRAHAKRDRIVLFKGSYHGHSDLTLGIGLGGGQVAPLSAGIPSETLQHLTILDYGSDEALRTIEALADELAAIVVEPVQSRRPDLQPDAFLRELRRITAERGVALVFDEMITGFRIGAGGAQAWFGIEADVVTYGKIVGGGMPVGVIAGKAAWLDYLDGGAWQFGDDSYPPSETIFYAGTFNKNPWTMAAARANLEEIRRRGPALFTEINRKTAYLAATLNAFYAAERIPIEVVHFASLFRFVARGNTDLFFFHMIERGIYVWEGRNCFLSEAHTDVDVERIIEAAKASALDMRAGGFLDIAALPARKSHAVTEAQRQLLLLGEIAPDGMLAYNIHLTTAIAGAIDPAALELAVNGLVRRHEALRAIFPPGADRQVILPNQYVSVTRLDLSSLNAPAREQAFAAWFDEENHRAFDLASGPLLRVTLARFDDADHRLVLALPHIVGDGITLNILLTDLIALYNGEASGRMASLEAALPFGDYVEWLAAQRESDAFRHHESYLLRLLAGPLPVLGLPLDHPRPAIKRYDAEVATSSLDASLAQALKRISRGHQATLFMTCLAAHLLLLHRITGDEDVIIGVPATGRAMDGSETIVGYLTHLLPIRSRLSGNPGFGDYLKGIKAALIDAIEHQDYPFAELLQTLDLPRDPSRSPLVSATFNMDQPPVLPAMGGATVSMMPPPVRFSSFELGLNITDLDGTLVVECKYHSSLFGPERMALFLEQYRALLTQIAEDASRGVLDFDLANIEGGAKLPDPAAPLPQPDYPLVTELLFRRAAEAPVSPAISAGGRVWCYGALLEEATAWAHALIARGIRPGDSVAVEGPRDGRLVSALLGIWLAGGVFVTLDDNLPPARRRTIVALADSRLLIALGDAESDSADDTVAVWHVPPDTELPTAPASPLPALSPEQPACLFFTSGTTGTPKGIVGLHKGVAHFVDWQRKTFGIGASDRVAQLTALSFDALLREIFLPLACGGTLHIPGRAELEDATRLVEWLAQEEIAVIHTVPSRARNWIAAAPRDGAWPALRRVFFSGEPLTPGLVEDWRAAFGDDALLVNLYGSTETTMTKCYRVIEASGDKAAPLGAVRPMSDTQALVLRGTRRCGVGELGEIVIRTPFRTAGYLDGGEAAAFAENPYRPGELFYRSGDQGRIRPDGSVEVLGRMDDQIKVRGIRVQPAEIQSVLDGHSAVQNSVVIARPTADGHELVAYVVPASGAGRSFAAELREFLAARLPPALVPRMIVMLPALPLLPNGKVDRHALPEPLQPAERPIVEPRNETQRRLLSAWREVLPESPIGVQDDFFEMGGNSLSATRIVSRIRADFAIELPLKMLFEHRTIEALAEQLALAATADDLLAGGERQMTGTL